MLKDDDGSRSTRHECHATSSHPPLRSSPAGFLIRLWPLEVRAIAREAAEIEALGPLAELLEHVLAAALARPTGCA